MSDQSGTSTVTGILPPIKAKCVDEVGRGLSLKSQPKLTPKEEVGGCCLATITGHTSTITQCFFGSSIIISSSVDGIINFWDAKTGQGRKKIICHKSVNDFVFLCQEPTVFGLIAGFDDGRFMAWCITLKDGDLDVRYGAKFSGHLPNPIRAMAASPDMKWLATGDSFLMNQITVFGTREISVRGTLKLWDLESMCDNAFEEGEEGHDKGPEIMRTMHQLAIRTLQRKASYSRLIFTEAFEQKSYGIHSIAYTPDGSLIVVGFGHPTEDCFIDTQMMVIFSSKTLETMWINQNNSYPINHLHFLPHSIGEELGQQELVYSSTYEVFKMAILIDGKLNTHDISHG